jgi:hypothetical protein
MEPSRPDRNPSVDESQLIKQIITPIVHESPTGLGNYWQWNMQ